MTLSERQWVVLEGVRELELLIEEEDGVDTLQFLIGRLADGVYADAETEPGPLDKEVKAVVDSLDAMGLVDSGGPTRPYPIVTEDGESVLEAGAEAVEFTPYEVHSRGEEYKVLQATEEGASLFARLRGLF